MPELRDLQRELKTGYQTLYVGVRDYPAMMSPSTAQTRQREAGRGTGLRRASRGGAGGRRRAPLPARYGGCDAGCCVRWS